MGGGGGGGVEKNGGHRSEIRSVPYGEGKQTPDFRETCEKNTHNTSSQYISVIFLTSVLF